MTLSLIALVVVSYLALHRDYSGAIANFQLSFDKTKKNLISYHQKLEQRSNFDSIQFEKHPFNVHVYVNDSLSYWSTNKIPVSVFADYHFPSDGIIHLQNGWYYVTTTQKDSIKIATSFLIRSHYQYENKYLRNEFDGRFNFPYKGAISLEKDKSFPIYDEGKFLFGIVPYEFQNVKSYYSDILIGLIILTTFFFLNTIQQLVFKRGLFLKFIVIAGLIYLRYLSLQGNWLSKIFEEITAFQPTLYASSELFPSFADLWINSLLILFTLRTLFDLLFENKEADTGIYSRGFIGIILLVACLFYNDFVFKSLIENSYINLEINKLFGLNFYSFLALSLVGLLFYDILNQYRKLLRFHQLNEFSKYFMGIFAFILVGIYAGINWYEHIPIKIWGLIGLIFICYHFFCIRFKKEFPNYVVIIILFIFSIHSFNVLQTSIDKKEKQERQLLANQLASDQDITTEIEYSQIKPLLENDDYIVKLLAENKTVSPSGLKDNLEKRFFNNFWEQYEVEFFLFNQKGVSLLNFTNNQIADIQKLDRIITYHSTPSEIDENIYYIKNFTSQYAYIIKQSIGDSKQFYGFLYIALKSKKIPENIGYPRLLISSKSKVFDVLENYSIAKYYNHQLVYDYGKFVFPSKDESMTQLINERHDGFANKRGYHHYIYRRTPIDTIIVSKPSNTTFQFFTTFSYLFCFYGLLLLFPLSEKILFKRKFRILPTLAVRIQILLIGIVLITLFAYGIGSGVFIQRQYSEITNQHLTDKLNSVNVDLKNLYSIDSTTFDAQSSDLLEVRLQNIARVFSTDINVFSTNGYLLASSRQKLYNSGLISEQINARALKHLASYNNSEYIHTENIGNLKYTSGYAPLYDSEGNINAYLNLQQFGQQEQYELQIENFLVSILNIFILLLAFTTMFTLFISNWITLPLKKLQESIANIRFGKYNQPIEYQGKDEIGELVKKYNEKLQELEYTAQQLAQSERENAWKEMAKQVAHEIKNPLTPMKLRLQHFQRIFASDAPIDKDQVDKIVSSMVEQIDTLAKIANEFSSFAKMPKSTFTPIDLVKIVQNVKEIYQSSIDTEIEFFHAKRVCYVLGDKDLLLRIFNNLIQNALQAVPDNRIPKISIFIHKQKNEWLIEVKDNGTGISEENQAKIFTPYFTTKTKGTGLGLAMVKQIVVDMHEGQISYETSNKGTVFSIVLKVHDPIEIVEEN